MKSKLQSAFTLVEIMVVVAIIGLLASIAIPCLKEAITTSRSQACRLNRKNIDAAKLRWSLANNQPITATPGEQELFGETGLIEHKPNCPAGGEYAIREVREKCNCNLVQHANKATD